jgi:hypothetical protein
MTDGRTDDKVKTVVRYFQKTHKKINSTFFSLIGFGYPYFFTMVQWWYDELNFVKVQFMKNFQFHDKIRNWKLSNAKLFSIFVVFLQLFYENQTAFKKKKYAFFEISTTLLCRYFADTWVEVSDTRYRYQKF